LGRLCWQADRSAAGVGLGSGCGTRSGDRGSVALYRHRMRIGRLDHGHDDGGHDDQGGPLSRAPTGKHSQGRSSPKSAQAPQERQLLLNLRIGHRWRHGRGTPRRRCGCCTLSDREGKACGGGRPVATRRPLTVRRLKKKARSDTSHFRAGFAGAKRGGRSSSGFRNRYETPWRRASRGKTDCPNPDESLIVGRPRPTPRPA
jgi:hypothetical protein